MQIKPGTSSPLSPIDVTDFSNSHCNENKQGMINQVENDSSTNKYVYRDDDTANDSLVYICTESTTKPDSSEDLCHLLAYILKKDDQYFVSGQKRSSQLPHDDQIIQGRQAVVLDKEHCESFETNEDISGQYDVIYSCKAIEFLQSTHELVPKAKEIIKRLACGEKSYTLSRKLKGSKEKIYEANLDEAKRILWCKDVAYSTKKKNYYKVIFILHVVLEHDKISKYAQIAEKWIQQGKIEGGTFIVKRMVKGNPSYYELAPENSADPKAKRVPYMMRDEYGPVPMYSLPEYVLKSIYKMPKEGLKRFGLPLRLSHEEHKLIDLHIEEKSIVNMSYHEKSLLVVGRSGTGKTTCCLMRLWEEFRHYWEILNDNKHPIIPQRKVASKVLQEADHSEEAKPYTQPRVEIEEPTLLQDKSSKDSEVTNIALEETVPITKSPDELCNHIHQVFVTKNPYLTREVKRRFYDFVSSHDKLQDHLPFESKPLPLSLEDINEFHYPLFLTSRELLILIDSTLDGETFFPRKQDGKINDTIYNSKLVYGDIEFADMTFQEDDDEDEDDDYDNEIEHGDEQRAPMDDTRYEMIEITASYFENVIWHKISKTNDEVNIDPIFVWQEIKSFIKGSVNAIKTDKGYLSRTDYLEVGKNKAPNFANSREKIYDLFLKYDKYCHSPVQPGKKFFDEGDLLFNLYNRLKKRPTFPWVVHNFYIDEVQDFTEAELYLLLSCSQCPNGNFLCGDSAQSIMRGVSFRFTDVRSLFYELNMNSKATIPDKPCYLTINYRAHAGILRVSESIIELMRRFFEKSFDAIPEMCQIQTSCAVNVQKPFIVYYNDPEHLQYILSGHQNQERKIEFGAHQAIIVPSEEVKKKLPEFLQKGAIVLTVFEAKGLEFNDVLLFNFFSDSTVRKSN